MTRTLSRLLRRLCFSTFLILRTLWRRSLKLKICQQYRYAAAKPESASESPSAAATQWRRTSGRTRTSRRRRDESEMRTTTRKTERKRRGVWDTGCAFAVKYRLEWTCWMGRTTAVFEGGAEGTIPQRSGIDDPGVQGATGLVLRL